jgi:PTH1 family peptidyl-tRNA hydrolase
MKMIVGLGNPGKKYEGTRHNFGFMVVDELCERYGDSFKFSKRFQSELCEVFIDGEKVILVKPQTFMNNSGGAVREILAFFDFSTDRVWVIYDDIDLELGSVRVRTGGTSGGHRGLQSVLDHLGTNEIGRFRMGIKTDQVDELSTEDIVLKKFSRSELPLVKGAIEKATGQIEIALKKGLEDISI